MALLADPANFENVIDLQGWAEVNLYCQRPNEIMSGDFPSLKALSGINLSGALLVGWEGS